MLINLDLKGYHRNMLKKYFVVFSTALTLSGVIATTSVSLVENGKVHASELGKSESSQLEDVNDKNLLLVENAIDSNKATDTKIYEDAQYTYTEINDENGNIVYFESIDKNTQEKITTRNTGKEVVVEKAALSTNGEYENIEVQSAVVEKSNINLESSSVITQTQNLSARASYTVTPWKYTHLAVGKNVFSTLVDIGAGALVGHVAVVFSISKKAAAYLLSYMGARYLSVGTAIANKLDSSGNGWIGLYVRYRQGPIGPPVAEYKTK